MPEQTDPAPARSPLAREAILFGICLFAGLVLMPLGVYFVGKAVLEAYAGGGFFRFWADWFRGLASGGLAWWLCTLGPYAFVLFIRGARLALR